VVFERLFGDGENTKPEDRLARLRENRSILDSVTVDVMRMMTDLGPGDRVKVNQYLEAIRDVERRIEKAEEQDAKRLSVIPMDRPLGVPATYSEYAKLMFDLKVLAYQADLTRVISIRMAREQAERRIRRSASAIRIIR
jgi:hypothetical protein